MEKKEAMKILKDFHDESALFSVRTALETLHPELKESEDERMVNQLHSWMNEFGGAEEYTEKVHQWLKGLIEKQGTSYTKKDVDDAYVEGMAFAKNELEKQTEQKPAWSEEDEKMIANIRDDLFCYQTEVRDEDHQLAEDIEKEINWLKSLKYRCSWKPSDEQITVLELASKYERVFTPKQIDILIGLKEQLKKLKKEEV